MLTTLFWITYIIAGLSLGFYWNYKLTKHIKNHLDNKSAMDCWCTTIYGDFLILGVQFSALVWPTVLLCLIVSVMIKVVRQLRESEDWSTIKFYPWAETIEHNVIVPNDAATAMSHKALRHLVNGCETHMLVCPYKEESLKGLINFSKEALNANLTAAGVMRMANLEERISNLNSKYNELVQLARNPIKLQEFVDHTCLCANNMECKLHDKL